MIFDPKFYFVLGFVLLLLVAIIIYRILRFLTSDFFVQKTGFQTYALIDGKKRYADIVYVIIGFLMNLMFLIPFYYWSIVTVGGFVLFYASLLIVVFWDYVLIGILLRLKYHYYLNEEREPPKRLYQIRFADFGMRWGLIHSISLVLFIGGFHLIHKPITLLIILVWFIILNTAIFPDYLNKIWKKDIRSEKGTEYYRKLYSIIGLISLYITFLL